MKHFASIIGIFICFSASAQKISNLRASLNGYIVTITYNIEEGKYDQKFKIELYSSIDNFTYPLTNVSGEIGNLVNPGHDKKINWNAGISNPGLDENVTFKIKASISQAPWKVFKPGDVMKIKRGVEFPVIWTGSPLTKNVTLELMKGDISVEKLNPLPNNGSTKITLPIKTKVGNGYQLKVSNSENPSEFAISKQFSIGRKVPLVVYIAPAAILLGAGGYFIFASPHKESSTTSSTPATSSDQLPNPPATP